MTEGFVSADVNLSWVERALAGLRNPDLRPAFREARKPLRADQRDHVKRQEGPSGAWPGRSPLTQGRKGKRKRSRKLLGKLPGALTAKHTRSSVSLTSRARWSSIHQEGGTAGQGARIPARPFLWVSQAALDAIGYVVSRHLVIAFKKVR